MKHAMRNPFSLIITGLAIVIVCPMLVQDGMFFDAVLYASVSNNLAQGIGSFWFPEFGHYNLDQLTSFHEQPPLGLGIQALFFKVLGPGLYTERIFTLLFYVVTALLIRSLYEQVIPEEFKSTSWLPILFWTTTPIIIWTYHQSMLENIVVMFSLTSAILLIPTGNKHSYLHTIIAGLFVIAGFLTKGIPTLFPLVIPLFHHILIKRKKASHFFLVYCTLLATLLMAGLALYLIPDSRISLEYYIQERLFARISNQPTVDNRFYTLFKLLGDLSPMLLTAALTIAISNYRRIMSTRLSNKKRLSLFFILIGLSGSLPLMLTHVQRAFYHSPTIPFFAIGVAIFIAPTILNFQDKLLLSKTIRGSLITTGMLLTFTGITLTIYNAGSIGRHKSLLPDVYKLVEHIPKGSLVTIDRTLYNNWSLTAYLMRYGNVATEDGKMHEYHLREKPRKPKQGYELVPIDLSSFHLCRTIRNDE